MSALQEADLTVETVAPSQAVVERVAACEGIDPVDLTPLYETVDPDAVDALVGTSDRNGSSLRIEFTYHGYDVTVTGDGVVHIDDADLER